ncbi:Putative phosphoheptose isomerase (modular protein) [Rhodospirillaceae bacterium LM-1]|nr:Putative phosphoheptose isomerase (modular protein) [Rhodospirillaceae bacterium LM-1]
MAGDLPPLVILAGGKASRLMPLTRDIPKSLLPVAGEPFLAHQLRLIARQGVKRVVLAIGHLADQIKAFAGDGGSFGLEITYSLDGAQPLGTGGALKQALAQLPGAHDLLVMYGDSYLETPFSQVVDAYRRSGKSALMTVWQNDNRLGLSNARFEAGRLIDYSKTKRDPLFKHIDWGLSVINRQALAEAPQAFDLADLFGLLLDKGDLVGYEVDRRFYEIGSFAGLADLNAHLNEGRPMSVSDYTKAYIGEAIQILNMIDAKAIDSMVDHVADIRANGGRLFFLGVGGGAGNCAHAVNDFRKIAGVESYAPTDNVSELTARINDDGWDSSFAEWLKGSRIGPKDGVFVFSVGGGNAEKGVSMNIVRALETARANGAKILGVIGRDGGSTAKMADACVVIPVVNPNTITPHTEAFQGVVWHMIVTHPRLKDRETKWESVK